MPLFENLEFGLVFGHNCWVRCFPRCVATQARQVLLWGQETGSFPGKSEFKKFQTDCFVTEFDTMVRFDFFGQRAAVPNAILLKQLFEKPLDFNCELPRLSAAFAVSQSFDAILLESIKVVVDALGITIEVLSELVCGPANGVESDDTGPESDFGVDKRAEFEVA
jgi:hypothetical protein